MMRKCGETEAKMLAVKAQHKMTKHTLSDQSNSLDRVSELKHSLRYLLATNEDFMLVNWRNTI